MDALLQRALSGDSVTSPAAPGPRRLHRPLLRWYAARRRDLPFRDVDDPYAVWVSEVMLQQTRVLTMVPYFLRWMERFPDVFALAAASEDEVLRLWSGLGYYSRGRNLHRAAKRVVAEQGGRLPRQAEALRRLPGVGPYTAGAVASIAFGQRVPAVDGNVLRVLARLDGDDRDVMAPATRKALGERAAALVPRTRPGDWNQALMELGATVCTPQSPACGACPVQGACVAFATGQVDRLPVRSKRAVPRGESRHFAYVERAGHVLMVREAGSGLLGGLWALPGAATRAELPERVAAAVGARIRVGATLGTARHRFTHRHWSMTVHRAEFEAPAGSVPAPGPAPAATTPPEATADPGTGEWRWWPRESLADAAVSTALRKALAVAWSPQDSG